MMNFHEILVSIIKLVTPILQLAVLIIKNAVCLKSAQSITVALHMFEIYTTYLYFCQTW